MMIQEGDENLITAVATPFNSSKYPKAIKFHPSTREAKAELCITCKKPGYRYYTKRGRGGTMIYYMHYDEPPMAVRESNNRLYFLYRRCTSRTCENPQDSKISLISAQVS